MSVPRFWREIPQRYTLQASRCGACERVDFPPRRICPDCRRASLGKMEPLRLSGQATVVHATRVHRAAPGYEDEVPYWIALIQTQEGPRLIGQIVEAEGRDISDGMAVEATFRRIGSDGEAGILHYGMKWRPVPVGDEEE